MRRLRLHIIFWIAYCSQGILLQFAYMQRFLVGTPVGKQLLMSTETSFALLPFRLLLTYFALYVLLKAVLSGTKPLTLPLLGMTMITAVCTVLVRMAVYYFVNPIIYHQGVNQAPLFNIMDIWSSLLNIVPVAAIAVFIKFVRTQFQNREKERSLLKEKLETELKLLRNQTNPHFLFNTLENIYALALKKSDDTPEVIMQLSKLLQFMLYESGKTMIDIGDEMKILDNYVELERIRSNNLLEIDFIREIDNGQEQIAPLLIFSFIKNAFSQGAGERLCASATYIDVKLQSGILNCNVETSRNSSHTGSDNTPVDLVNTRRQVELLYTDYSLSAGADKELFKAGLVINLHSHVKI
jgi:two-component system, LytTR family, sensor kinase